MENKILNTGTEKEPVKVEEMETPKMETANVEELKAKEETVKAENLTAARESMKEEKAEAKEDKFQAYALEKLNAMKAELNKKKEGWFSKMMIGKDVLDTKLAVVEGQIKEVMNGKMVDLVSVKKLVKFADDVDVSDAPERANKDYSYGGVQGHNFGGGK